MLGFNALESAMLLKMIEDRICTVAKTDQAYAQDIVKQEKLYKLQFSLTLSRTASLFRWRLSRNLQYLRPLGNCVRDGLQISAELYFDSLSMQKDAIQAIQETFDECRIDVPNDPEIHANVEYFEFDATPGRWRYRGGLDSPCFNQKCAANQDLPDQLADEDTPSSAKRSKSGSDAASDVDFQWSHIVHKKQWQRTFTSFLENIGTTESLDKLKVYTIYMPYRLHRLFDGSAFYFTWRFEAQTLFLRPVRMTSNQKDADTIMNAAHFVALQDITGQNADGWCKALALRKWATIADHNNGHYSKKQLIADYGAHKALCWDTVAQAEDSEENAETWLINDEDAGDVASSTTDLNPVGDPIQAEHQLHSEDSETWLIDDE